MSLALGILGAVGALAGTAAGAIGSAIQNKKVREYTADQRAKNEAWWQTKRAEDYTQRADAQAIINKQRELYEEQQKRLRGANVVAGGTDESLQMARESADKGVAETMANIAAQGAVAKDQAEAQYRQQEQNLANAEAGLAAQQSANIANAAGQVAGAGVQLAGVGFDNYFKKKN